MLNPQLIEASKLFASNYRLTPRETEIFAIFLEGSTPEDAAKKLDLSVHTIRNHIKNMLRSTKTNSLNQFLAKFIRDHFELSAQPPEMPAI